MVAEVGGRWLDAYVSGACQELRREPHVSAGGAVRSAALPEP